MSESERFAALKRDRRVWAVAAVHGEADRLRALHDALGRQFAPGDAVVYLGNLLGRGPDVAGTVDEALLFRRAVLARPGSDLADVVFLRGSQEEMWQKLLTIQFAPNPREVLAWMAEHGIGPTLAAYGSGIEEGRKAAKEGVMGLTHWTGRLRQAVRARDGHTAFLSSLRRAAFTEPDGEAGPPDGAVGGSLFVHAGIDPERPLSEQSDSFWWGAPGFDGLDRPYAGFARVVRGHDHRRRGVRIGPVAATLDGGCGFGGPLVAAAVLPSGEITARIEA